LDRTADGPSGRTVEAVPTVPSQAVPSQAVPSPAVPSPAVPSPAVPGAVPPAEVAPALVTVAHGSRHPSSVPAIEALLGRVRALRPGLVVRAAYLEIVPPAVPDALAATPGAVVVLPLLLSTGYHAAVDLPGLVADRLGAAVADVLGPDPLLATALADRLHEAGWRAGDLVVLGVAGSSDPAAATAAERQAALLGAVLGTTVTVGYASAAEPSVAAAVAAARAGAGRVAVATYLLAPGAFGDRMAAAGADLVSAALGDHPAVAGLVLVRYDQARGQRS
jgi:sirohydrochlorin ferrochelatase